MCIQRPVDIKIFYKSVRTQSFVIHDCLFIFSVTPILGEHYKRIYPISLALDNRRSMGPWSIDAANMAASNLKFACAKYYPKVLKMEENLHVKTLFTLLR